MPPPYAPQSPVPYNFYYNIVLSDEAAYLAYAALYPNGVDWSPQRASLVTGFPLQRNVVTGPDGIADPPYVEDSFGLGYSAHGAYAVLEAAGQLGVLLSAAIYVVPPLPGRFAAWFCSFSTGGVPIDSGISVLVNDGTGVVQDPNDSNIYWTDLYPSPLGTPWADANRAPLAYSFHGSFVLKGGGPTGGPPPTEAIMQRRWIEGWEIPLWDSGSGGSFVTNVLRAASRTPEGYGLSIRDRAQAYTRTVDTFLPGPHRGSWERLYSRLRTLPTGNYELWRCFNSANPAVSGAAIHVTNAGALEVYNINAASVYTLIGTVPNYWPLNTYIRTDIIVRLSSGANDAIFEVYKNGVSQLSLSVADAAGGIGLAGFHSSTRIGGPGAGVGLEMDLDDWINSEIPLLKTGVDWLNGSHVALLRPDGFDPSHDPAWVGDWRTLMNNPGSEALVALTSSTAGARMAVTTDGASHQGAWTQEGVAAFAVSILSANAGATDGQLGYSAFGGPDVLVTIDEGVAEQNRGMMYNPAGMLTPDPVFPIVLLHTKSPDGNLGTVWMLEGMMECLGRYGDGDELAGTTPPVLQSIHNAPYVDPSGMGSLINFPSDGVVMIESGTYVGNGLGQDITLTKPPHWIYIRPLTPASGMPGWFSGMINTHAAFDAFNIEPHLMPQALIDVDGTPKMRIAGDDAQNNFLGRTYQYVCVSDVSARFVLSGAFQRPNTVAAALTPIDNSVFFPEAAFLQLEQPQSIGTAFGGYYKGKGHSGSTASPLNGAQVSNALTFGLGSMLTQQPPFHPSDQSVAYCLWRISDGPGNGGPGGPCDPDNPDPKVVAITFYTGNGVSPRDIPVNLAGRLPLFALVVPHNGSAIVRDPSHTGLTSSAWATGVVDATQGIRGGDIDKITVGTTLNALGIVYDVFVIVGEYQGAGPGGWSTNGAVVPIAPRNPCNPRPPEPPPPPPPGPGEACPVDFPTELT